MYLLTSIDKKYLFVSLLLDNMGRFLLMNKSRVLLEEVTTHGEQLAMKLCINEQIMKFPNKFRWSEECQRWQSFSLIRFEYFLQCPLELQLYFMQDTIPLVVGEGIIDPSIVNKHLNEEIKLLRYDGLVTGWLYCQFCFQDDQDNQDKPHQKYISLQKINLHFLEEIEEQIQIKIKQNTIVIFEKRFFLNHKSKTIFPNIKRSVRLSDVIKIELAHSKRIIQPITFMVDNIKRGTTSTLQFWVRNNFKNKMGSCSLEYYMQNLYLSNERFSRSRKAIIPDSIQYQKTSVANKIVEKENANQNEVKKKIEDADKRIQKINSQVKQMVNSIKSQQKILKHVKKSQTMLKTIQNGLNILSVRKRKANIKSRNNSSLSIKQKLSFYFQNQNK